VLRNQNPITGFVELRHGDLLTLGEVLELRYLKPLSDNGTSLLEIEGSREVLGCRRILLLGGTGRAQGIVIGPGPEAHISLPMGAPRVELFRECADPESPVWIARSPRGVALASGPERPQVRVTPGEAVKASALTFLLADPATLQKVAEGRPKIS
jgi:hypothetical protein